MSWKRKSEREISVIDDQMKREARKPHTPALFSGTTIVLSFLGLSFLPSMHRSPEPAGMTLKGLTLAVSFGAIAFTIMYLVQLKTKRNIGSDTGFGICDRCHETNHDGKRKCHCGGRFEPNEFYEKI
ncbi:hypothetical protein QEH53_23265 [Pelagicoccus sp. SDUM812002]|nr:hypothetical protein [Pelagicoccus sp. SDUM812002]